MNPTTPDQKVNEAVRRTYVTSLKTKHNPKRNKEYQYSKLCTQDNDPIILVITVNKYGILEVFIRFKSN